MFYKLCTASLLLAAAVTLSGCGMLFGDEGVFRDRSDDYLDAGTIAPMDIPATADPGVFEQLYVIPRVEKSEFEYPDEFSVPRPQALAASVYSEKVKLQRLGDRRWIAINSPPAEVWPRVRNFLNTNGLRVARTVPERGLIETNWLQFKDDPDRDKYQLRIEQGVQPDSTEIHVLHTNASLEIPAPTDVAWPEQSVSAEKESWMVDELAASLARDTGAGSASLLAQTIGGSNKVEMVSRDRDPVLHMDLSWNRAWATVSYALNEEGFRTIDSDSEQRLIYADYTPPEDSEGFFSGWFRDDDKPDYTLAQVLDSLELPSTPDNNRLFPAQAFNPAVAPAADSLKSVPGYLVSVRERDGGVDVVIRTARGEKLPPRDARDLLNIIQRNLI